MDALSQLITNEITHRLELAAPRLIYGVWITNSGWLKNEQGRAFADEHIELAQTAARLWGHGAVIMPIDDSLKDFERVFLMQQSFARQRTWWNRLTIFIKNGIS